MGYGTTQKVYKLCDLQNHVFFISRDVFTESIFPFHTQIAHDMQDIESHDETQISPLKLSPVAQIPLDNAESLSVQEQDLTADYVPNHAPDDSAIDHVADVAPEDHAMPPTTFNNKESNINVPLGRRRSTRTHRPPIWQKDFVTRKSKPNPHCLYSIADSVSYENLSHSYQCCIANISVDTEPQFYHQAIKDWQP